MKRYLTLTIDVEPDCSGDWKYSDPLSFTGISEGIANKLQPLFNKYHIVPTYLVNNVVLEDDNSIEVLKSLKGKFELGTHLHPEFIEPQKKFYDYAGKKGEANLCLYDKETEFKKLENITNLFTGRFGYPPTSFRAGRFSAGDNTINSLKKLNYKVDTSVTPGIKWKDRTRQKPIDFTKAKDQPYWVGDKLDMSVDSSSLLEVPVSIIKKRLPLAKYIKRNIMGKGSLLGLSESIWLRPVFAGMDDFKMVMEEIEKTHEENTPVVYNMMFHNVEVMPGLSPYSATEQDCKNYLALLETFFQYISQNNITSIELSGLHEIFR